MSKKNSVNPNFYKVGGNEHEQPHNQAVNHEKQKERMDESKAAEKRQGKTGQPNLIPGGAPTGQRGKNAKGKSGSK